MTVDDISERCRAAAELHSETRELLLEAADQLALPAGDLGDILAELRKLSTYNLYPLSASREIAARARAELLRLHRQATS